MQRATRVPFVRLMKWLLESTWGWRQVAKGDNHVIRGWDLLVPPPDFLGGERGWRLSSIASGQWYVGHWLDGRESEWTPGVCDGQGGLACCDSWGRKESDMTERLIWSDLILAFCHHSSFFSWVYLFFFRDSLPILYYSTSFPWLFIFFPIDFKNYLNTFQIALV